MCVSAMWKVREVTLLSSLGAYSADSEVDICTGYAKNACMSRAQENRELLNRYSPRVRGEVRTPQALKVLDSDDKT